MRSPLAEIEMLGRALQGLLIYGILGPVFGGLVVGLVFFLSDPRWSTALLPLLTPVIGFPIGVAPAAATGAIAGALAPGPRQARWHFMGVALLGACLSAVAAHIMKLDPVVISLGGFVASLACEYLRRELDENLRAIAKSRDTA